jgi:hypothetical protein
VVTSSTVWPFALALMLGSALLFVIEPMLGKMLLPALGSAPAVWTTCMLFFQAALLVGYGYAHGVSAWLGPRRQAAIHVAALGIAALALPVTFRGAMESVPSQADPTGWLLAVLVRSAGPVFVVVAATAPSLQSWFAHTRGRGAQDPYFLYAASNLGSLAGLLAYPILIEPVWTLPQQAELWTAGYALLVVLVVACAGSLWGSAEPTVATAKTPAAPPGLARRALWVALSFVPSSLMLGATTYITTDLAAIPLLWIVPLALYLATLVAAFSRARWLRGLFVSRALCALSLPLLVAVLTDATSPAAILIPLHLLTLFLGAGACHAELAAERPPPAYLTEYFLWIAAGGALGGVFNAVVAPMLFRSVAEYPLTIVLACLLGRRSAAGQSGARLSRADWAFAAALGLLIAAATHGARAAGPATSRPAQLLVYLVPALVCYRFVERPARFALGLGAIVLNGLIAPLAPGTIVHAERNFFGIVRVRHIAKERFHDLVHGNTIHGRQSLDAADRDEPLSYYHRKGPLGQIFGALDAAKPAANVAVVGLGAGAVNAYRTAGQSWSFYEINPAVVSIACDPRYFTFLRDCGSPGAPRIVLGDARLRLAAARPHVYDLILLDAFSSDAIPLHLVTREALALYLDKLAADGILVFHVSQRLLDIAPVLAALADDAGLTARERDDRNGGRIVLARGQDVSRWVLIARRERDLGDMAADPRWRPLARPPGVRLWTDDYSNVLGTLRGGALVTELANATRQW